MLREDEESFSLNKLWVVQGRLSKEFKYFREAWMTADRIEIRVVFHPVLSFPSGVREKVHQ
jgi:hypothetical protein